MNVTLDPRKQIVFADSPTVTWSKHNKSNCVIEIRATAKGGTSSVTPVVGGVISVNAEDLQPLFTVVVANLTSTPNIIFSQVAQDANLFYASPNGANGLPIFREIANDDLGVDGDNTKFLRGDMTWQVLQANIIVPENVTTSSVNIVLGGTPTGASLQPFSIDITTFDVTAGSSKIILGGTPTDSVLQPFSIDVDESQLILQSSQIENQVDYPIIGYMGLEHTYEWAVPVEWTYPGEFIIVIDENWNFVGSANNLTNLLVLLNDLGLGVFTTAGGIITVVGNHEYGDILELTGSEVAPSGVLAIDMAAPAAILDVLGFSTRRISQNQLRATDTTFINTITPCDFKFGDPWPDPHSHWYHVAPLGGGDGPNYVELETVAMGKTLENTQDGIGDVTYGYDWFLDFANTMQALGITEANVSLNVLSLLIQQIKTYDYNFLSATTSTDPGSGNFKLNNFIPASVTAMYISKLDDGGIDISARLAGWTTISLYVISTPTIFSIYDITNTVDNGTYFTLTLSYVAQDPIPAGFTNLDPVRIIVVEEDNPDPVNANAISYTAFYDEVDFIVSHLASKGITVRLFQFILEISIGNLKPAVHSTADYTTVVAKMITDFFEPNYPTIERSTDAVSVQETARFPDFNADVALLDVELARQYFHFWDYLTTYQDNRDRMTEYPTVCDMFESVFPYFNMMITQAPCKGGNPFRNKVGEGLIFSEFCMWVLEENLTRGNLTTGLNFYDASRLISGDSNTIYAATYFVQLLTDMFKNDGAVTGIFTDVPQSSSLHYVTVKRGLTAEVYVINPTAFPITVSTVTVNGVAKNVSVESYYADPSSDTASHYLVALGTVALMQPFSLTKITTL